MLQAFSQTEKALRDTSLRYADSESFDLLAQDYGFPRPPAISVKAWRSALRVVLWGARGMFHTLNAFLREALMDFAVDAKNVSMLDSLDGFFYIAPDIVPGNGLGSRPLRRWNMHVDSNKIGPYKIVGRDLYATLPDGSKITCRVVKEMAKGDLRSVYLPMVDTAYWKAPPVVDGKFTAKILPFTLEEPNPHPGRNWLYVRKKQAVPGHWLYLYDYNEDKAKIGNGWEGKTATDFSNKHNKVILRLFTGLTELFNFKFTYWQHTGMEKYEQGDAGPTGIANPDLPSHPSAERPDNQAMGGHVQTDESYLGDPNGEGPFPPYFLDDEFLTSSQSLLWSALQKLMPDGCHLVIQQAYPHHKYPTMGKTPEKVNDPVGGLQAGWQPGPDGKKVQHDLPLIG